MGLVLLMVTKTITPMMNELKVKKNFTNIYTEDSPHGYLKEME